MATEMEKFGILDKVHGFSLVEGADRRGSKQLAPINWKPFISKVLTDYNNLKSSRGSSDSGYGSINHSSKSNRTSKQSRWTKMSEVLLHKDTKCFLKKNIPSADSDVTSKPRQPPLSKKYFAFVDDHSDDEDEFNEKMLKSVQSAPKNMKSIITKSLLMLSGSISEFVNQSQIVDRIIFNFDTVEVDLKAMFMMFEPNELLQRVVSLVNRFNLTDLSKVIYEMEVGCAMRELPIDNFEAGCADLKISIDRLRKYAMNYINGASVESANDLIKVIRHLSLCFGSITCRLWILSSMISNF